MFKKFKKVVATLMAAAAIMTVCVPMTAKADDYLTVVGNITLSGGSGNIEDVKVSVRYGNITAGHEDTYMAKVVWTGSPKANGHYAVNTEAYKDGLHVLKVTAELEGYRTTTKGLGIGQNSADLILVADESAQAYNVSGAITMNGALITPDLCPMINFNVLSMSQAKDIKACGGSYNCNAPAGSDIVITPTLAGYTFSPESIKIEKIGKDTSGVNFVMTKSNANVPETEVPETETDKNKVTLYFMTGSTPADPGEVFAEFEVAKNSRKNTTTIANTVGNSVPKKEGYTFSHWREGKLSDSSVLGNKVSNVIWTNESDQYIYAQYDQNKTEEKVTLYFMTGSSPDDPGEVFAEFEVPKNSRGNTTTIAKTISTAVPCKAGCNFSHWREAKLSDPSVLGNKVTGVIWTNEQDQYIYAQYK